MPYELALFEFIADSAILLDKAGRIMEWSQGATLLFGYTKKEVMGRSVNLLFDRNYPFPKLIQETAQKKWVEETLFIRKNGAKGHCKSTLCYFPYQNKITALLIQQNISSAKKIETELMQTCTRLTEKLQESASAFLGLNILLLETHQQLEKTEKKLSESELRFHLLAQNATDIISRHTPDGNYLYVSPACKNSLGFQPEDLIGKSMYRYLHNDDSAKVKRAFTRRKENANHTLIYRIRKKEGDYRWFESHIRLIQDQYSRTVHEIQLASRDVTDRILDKKARLRGQQLAHISRLSTMEEMASGIAHEVTQPLAAIVNYTQGCVRHLQNNHSDSTQLINIMGKAVAQAERAGEIVQRLKNFFCKGQLVKTSCKINNVIRETISLMKTNLSTSKTKIDFAFDKNVPPISIDKIQIQQVVLNLIQNGIESMLQNHTREKRIHIQSKSTATNMIEVTITDAGPGFSKEIINKVFKPFFTTKAHGRGMGLAICRSIIEAHGGEFTINPNTHTNSWIRFSLPFMEKSYD